MTQTQQITAEPGGQVIPLPERPSALIGAEQLEQIIHIVVERLQGAGAGYTPPREGKEPSLHSKLADVMAQISGVQKDGRNPHFNYAYTSAEAYLREVRIPLAEKKVMLLWKPTNVAEKPMTTSRGSASTLTTVTINATFVDGESGERETISWIGRGDDAGDKGISKALTSAAKTFVRMQFLIDQGHDNPEADGTTDQRAEQRTSTINEKQQRMLFAKARDHGLSSADLTNIMLAAVGNPPENWVSDDAAREFLNANIASLPASAVNDVVKAIETRQVPQAAPPAQQPVTPPVAPPSATVPVDLGSA